jgi:hypothetical protein
MHPTDEFLRDAAKCEQMAKFTRDPKNVAIPFETAHKAVAPICKEIAPFDANTFGQSAGQLIARAASSPLRPKPRPRKRATPKFTSGH